MCISQNTSYVSRDLFHLFISSALNLNLKNCSTVLSYFVLVIGGDYFFQVCLGVRRY